MPIDEAGFEARKTGYESSHREVYTATEHIKSSAQSGIEKHDTKVRTWSNMAARQRWGSSGEASRLSSGRIRFES
jgi:hypothetical protein